jgi:hypothetical protein
VGVDVLAVLAGTVVLARLLAVRLVRREDPTGWEDPAGAEPPGAQLRAAP